MLVRVLRRVAALCDKEGRIRVDLDAPQGSIAADLQVLLVNDLLRPVELKAGPHGSIAYGLTPRAHLVIDAKPMILHERRSAEPAQRSQVG